MGPLNSPFPGTLSPIPPQPVNMIQQPSTSLHTTNGTDPAHQPPDLQHSHTPSTSTSPIREAMPQALSISVPAASGSQGRPPIGTTSSVPEQPLAQPTIQFGRGFSTLEDHGSQSARARVPVIVRTFFNREGRERRHIARIIFQPAFTLTQVSLVIVFLHVEHQLEQAFLRWLPSLWFLRWQVRNSDQNRILRSLNLETAKI